MKKEKRQLIFSGLFLLLVTIGAGAGYLLTQQNQDVRQQAYGDACRDNGAKRCINGFNEVCSAGEWTVTSEKCGIGNQTPPTTPPITVDTSCKPGTCCQDKCTVTGWQ